jgi:protein-disulfide isomerase
MNKFNNCLNNDTDLSKVNQITTDVQNGVAGFQGTPMFFVNGQAVQASWTALQAAINAA